MNYRRITPTGEEENLDLQAVIAIPGFSLEACTEAVRRVVRRHESLRTLYVMDHGMPPSQNVQADVVIHALVDTAPGPQAPSGGNRLLAMLTRSSIDTRTEPPIRVGFSADAEGVRQVVVVVSRMAVDGWGYENLLRELLREARHPNEEKADTAQVFQQLDQFTWEQSTHGKRREEAAIAYRAATVGQVTGARPQQKKAMFTDGSVRHGGVSLGLEAQAALSSLSKRYSVSTSTLLLAAFALESSKALDLNDFLIMLHSANRFDPLRMRSVTRLKSTTLLPCRNEPSRRSFEQLAAEMRDFSMTAYWNSQLSPEIHVSLMDSRAAGWRTGNPLIMQFNDRRVLSEMPEEDSSSPPSDIPVFPDTPAVAPEAVRHSEDATLDLAVDPCVRTGGVALQLETNLLSEQGVTDLLSGIRKTVLKASRKD
ncbi:hypothetical protein [Streptomyces sp. NPDC057438]|uniref:hypothetical protein n=1 Tax=Streptomyces sp. NPDC057438 TaxID=3346133 RepID=UPI0036B68414